MLGVALLTHVWPRPGLCMCGPVQNLALQDTSVFFVTHIWIIFDCIRLRPNEHVICACNHPVWDGSFPWFTGSVESRYD